MSEQMMYLTAVVGADATQFRRTMSQVRDDVGILSNTIGGISGAARSMTYAFSAPMVALGTLAVNAAAGFDASMRNINSIIGLSEEKFASLSAEAFAFAKTTRDGVVPATDALYEIFSAGITDQDKAMALWKVSTRVAEAGVADLSKTTNALTATMNAFNMSQEDSERIGNVWTRMVQVGVGSMTDFLSNAQKILPLSNLLGVSLEDMGASVAFLSQGGGGAAKAETAFAMMLSNILKPTEAMNEAFDRLGVSTGSQLIAKFKSVGAAVQALKGVSDETMFNKMFSKTGLEAAGMMTTNAAKLTETIATFNDSLDTATMDAWTEQSKSFAFQFDLLKTSLTGVATVIGQAIIPMITPLIQSFTEILTSVSETNPQLVQMGVVFVGLVAAAAPVIWLLTSMLNPIGLVVGAIGALALAFTTNFGGMRDTLTTTVNDMLGSLQPLQDGLQTFIDALFGNTETEVKENIIPSQLSIGDILTINPQDKAISLWDFYEGEGAIEQFSWDEFQKMAKDAGWDGGAIKPGDILKLILPNGTGAGGQDMTDSWLRAMMPEPETMKDKLKTWWEEGTEDNSIGGRLAAAFEEAWPKIKPALENILANVKTWIDTTLVPGLNTAGGDILETIAGWFNPKGSTGKGNTQIFNNLAAFGNGGGAAVAEGLNNDFQKNFPDIAAGFTALFTNMGKWIEVEGVPTLARSIGYLAGKISVLIGTALGSIWGSITGGETASGVGQATSAIGKSFMTPLNEGFQQSIGEAGVNNPTDAFFTNLSAALVAGAVAWKIAPDFATNIVTTIAGAINTKLGVTTAFNAVASTFGTKLSEAIIGKTVLKPVADAAGDMVMTPVKTGLSGIASSISTALSGALGGVTLPAIALTFAAVTATVLAIHLLINESARNQAHEALASILDGIFGETFTQGIVERFTMGIYSAFSGLAFIAADLSRLLGQPQAIQDAWRTKGEEWGKMALDSVNTVVDLEIAKLGNDPKSVTIELVPTFDVPTAPPIGVPNAGTQNAWMMPMPSFEPSTLVPRDLGTKVVAETGKVINETTIPPETFAAFETNMGTVLDTAISTGNLDGQKIVDDFVVPVATGFSTNFAADSPAALAWTSFIASVTKGNADIDTGFILISQDIALLLADVTKNMPGIATAVLGALNPIIGALNEANFIAKNLSATLASLDGATVTVTTSVSGGTAVDGTHAMGLDRVPFDGYIAELHKGEKVLTANEANQYGSSSTAPRFSPTDSSTSNNYYVTITGVNDLDGMLKEARRRGIPLVKR